MKNWKVLLTAAFAAALFALPGAASAQICGDVNDNGDFTLADCSLLSQCVAGLTNTCTVDTPDESDFNDDGAIDAADLVACVFVQAGLETLFDPCSGQGPDRDTCAGANDPITGLPTEVIPSSTITASETWINTCTYYLDGTVFVQTPSGGTTAVLTIEPGTVIKGVKDAVDPATLVFLTTDDNGDDVPDRTAKINAVGTPGSPIVFTSDQAIGSRNKEDWAGVMFNGRSTVNRPNCVAAAEGLPTTFGGCKQDDSSGIARFVRVEFGGRDFTENNELNLWTMNGIGSGTDFDFIQANTGNDDCHEWFGGTSKHTNLVASNCGDDGLDYQLGFTGSVQYAVMFQNGQVTDTGADSRGIEGDNSEFGHNDQPRSNPKMCNVTLVGGKDGDGQVDNNGSDSGMVIRRGSSGQFRNFIVTGFTDSGFEMRDSATATNACNAPGASLTGNLDVRSAVFYDNGAAGTCSIGLNKCASDADCAGGGDVCNGEVPEQCQASGLVLGACDPDGAGGKSDSCGFYDLMTDVLPVDPTTEPADPGVSRTPPALLSGEVPQIQPTGTLPTASSCSDIDPSFEDSGYVGAIDPGASCTVTDCDWMTTPWLDFDFE
jgi:hypothetical protein